MLDWPPEIPEACLSAQGWRHAGTNICLDFHGDPLRAELVLFSDGNHHMALHQALDSFCRSFQGLGSIFYATTPPGPLLVLLREGRLCLGNLILSLQPHVFISPPDIMDQLAREGRVHQVVPLVRNQGNVLLVARGNPLSIQEVDDLLPSGARVFLSNPETEKASHTAYARTLKAMAAGDGGLDILDSLAAAGNLVVGERIHHREAPEAVASGRADAAMVYYHLALRYKRLFPESFDIVPLGGSVDRPQPGPGNVISRTSMGLVDQGGTWGRELISFFQSQTAQDIYISHGLLPDQSPMNPGN
ncbi:MAG: substrate-binding domain-containing protein [Desulfovermiculus sp.]|nr:substrate-binding domain-containing protein [Desulfovermiculus sp.]